MTEIEHRVETTARTPRYSTTSFSEEELTAGRHREFIGGNWDTHGRAQLDFLVEHGLQPSHRFLDVGCGALRAGRHLVDYLEPGHYYGIDANLELIQAGYDRELTDAQRSRLPSANLRANDRFDGDFGVSYDVAIAQSVFTHVSLNHVRLCLYRVAQVMRPGGTFYVTFNEEPASRPVDTIIPGRTKPRMTERNVFWYYREDLRWASTIAPWQFRYIGDWSHPHGQMMVELTRLEDGATARQASAADRARAALSGVRQTSPQGLPRRLRRTAGRGLRRVARRLDR